MGTGYTRNDTPNNIADGNVINASDLDGEFDAVQAAFNGSTGHSHDGTTGEGPQIDTAGLADGAVTSAKLANNIQIAGTLGVTGETTLSTHLNMGDNDIIKLGAGADLQIYHDASNSQIINSVGHLNIDNNGDDKQINLRSDDGSGGITNYIRVNGNTGAVQLYNYGSQKLATTATGIDVTGTATMDGLTVQDASAGRVLTGIFQNTTNALGTSSGISLRNSADTTSVNLTAERVGSNAGADLVVTGFDNAGVEKNFMRITEENDISFYEDTGTTAKLFWDASEESLGIGTSSPSFTVDAFNATDNGIARFSSGDANSYIAISDVNTTSANNRIGVITHDMYFDTNGSEAMRIDSSGNVGIGTDSPDDLLHLRATAQTGASLRLENSSTSTDANTVYGTINFEGNDASAGASGIRGSIVGGSDNISGGMSLEFSTAAANSSNTERMRIDSSGNLLVGTTTAPSSLITATSGGGHALTPNYVAFTRQSADASYPVVVINETGVDGILTEFRKDGTTVGSIGTEGSRLTIGTGDVGLKFDSGLNQLIPFNISSNAVNDDVITLGRSTSRFKNLYLSGGVYLGGTGSANLLDDYEEGTWTALAEFSSANPTAGAKSGVGSYIKVGKLCTVTCTLDNINVTGASGDLKITGLPFGGSTRTSIPIYMGPVRTRSLTVDDGYLVAQIQDGVTHIDIFENNYSSGGDNINTANCSHGASDFNVTITYETN